MIEKTLAALAGALAFVAACAPAAQAPDASPAPIPVRIEIAVATPRQEQLSAFGEVEISPDHSQSLTLTFDAIIVAVRAAPGETVAKGAALLDIRPAPTVALDLRRAQDALQFAQREFDRVQRLRTQNLATNAELDAAEQSLATVRAVAQDLSARIAGGGVRTIKAPSAGIVESISVEPGASAPAGTELARVGDSRNLQARFGVEVEDIVRIAVGAEATVTALSGNGVSRGKVLRVLRRVDPATRLAQVTVAFEPGAIFLPGAPVRAAVAVGGVRDLVTLPRSAVIYGGQDTSVFVVDKGLAKRVPVSVGAEFGDRVEVLSGLAPGASVVVDGNANIEDGARLAPAQAAKE